MKLTKMQISTFLLLLTLCLTFAEDRSKVRWKRRTPIKRHRNRFYRPRSAPSIPSSNEISAKYILPLYKDGSVSESDEPIPKSQKVNLFKKEARPNSRRMSNRLGYRSTRGRGRGRSRLPRQLGGFAGRLAPPAYGSPFSRGQGQIKRQSMFCECDSGKGLLCSTYFNLGQGYQMIDCQRNGFPSGIVPVGRGYSPSGTVKGSGPSVYCSCATPGPLVCQMMSPEAIANLVSLAEKSTASISPPAYGASPPMGPTLPNNSSSINISFYGPTYDYYGDYYGNYDSAYGSYGIPPRQVPAIPQGGPIGSGGGNVDQSTGNKFVLPLVKTNETEDSAAIKSNNDGRSAANSWADYGNSAQGWAFPQRGQPNNWGGQAQVPAQQGPVWGPQAQNPQWRGPQRPPGQYPPSNWPVYDAYGSSGSNSDQTNDPTDGQGFQPTFKPVMPPIAAPTEEMETEPDYDDVPNYTEGIYTTEETTRKNDEENNHYKKNHDKEINNNLNNDYHNDYLDNNHNVYYNNNQNNNHHHDNNYDNHNDDHNNHNTTL
ncbi:Oidioi.mRNA.OKI2018_I69.chr1.g2991.t1.cds [Oikopleura dioica]|uniref:Oidioi.mRNA.OKI2018_I69.chr1.g2991.t1.cds n=1 Tax=Oikopleura dioica TaxID=34765 RepID=A0ABN7SZ75_OIKDI|nr:Oidioi.mRNA.OKI2018_I69.chr1.g2991.t1.cds [Oikopleura dioica]